MIAGTLQRYIAVRFLSAVVVTFVGVVVLTAMIDYIELMRRTSDLPNASVLLVAQTSIFRVPQVTERAVPFCVLVGTMFAYLTMSRRLELVVARAAGVSVWQFITPALVVALALGAFATFLYNPVSATLQEHAKRLEAGIFGQRNTGLQQSSGGSYWVTQRSGEGYSIINAGSSLRQGVELGGVTVFHFDNTGRFRERVEAKRAVLEVGHWRLDDARVYAIGGLPRGPGEYLLPTQLTSEEIQERFSTPEGIPIWSLPEFIDRAERVGLKASAYRLHLQKLLAQPFLFASMVLLAAASSLRFFRFGGIQKMILSGVAAGFLLFIFSKIIDDMSKAELLHPAVAAWLPVLVAGLIGLVALLYQEDG